MDKLKIAITGSTGLVGSRIVELVSDEFEFILLRYPEFDITKRDVVYKVLKGLSFDVFLHLAAYTDVDGAEKNQDLAFKVNVEGTKNVFEAVDFLKKKFIYISTGFVFDGKNPPFFEDSKPNPLSVYARTKYEGEKIVKGKAMIVRIDYPYRKSFPEKKDFFRAIKERLEKGQEVLAVEDMLITPTFIDDIAYGLKYLFKNFTPEIFHLVGSKSYRPYDLGRMIAKKFSFDESLVKPISFKKFFEGRAPRPQWNEMKTKKNDFFKMKSFEEAMEMLGKVKS